MNWSEARLVLLVIATFSLTVGVFFYVLGAPLVLPFSGLEVLALTAAFYVVLRAGQEREVVRIVDEQLVIERGRKAVRERFEFSRFWVRVELKASRKRFHPKRLLVGVHGRSIELGHFLTDWERESFALSLINALKKNG